MARASRSVRTCDKVVSHELRFVAVLIPKAARSTLLRVMTETYQRVFHGEVLKAGLPRLYGSGEFDDYFKFAFVRDPWSRVVSCYLSKIADPPNERVLALLEPHPGLKPAMSFEAFVRWLTTDNAADAVADRHWASQYLFVTKPNGALAVDFIGCYDRLDQDFAQVCATVGIIPPSLPVINSRFNYVESTDSVARADYYLDFYTPDLAEMVSYRYAKDIELFGFDHPPVA